VLVAFDRDYRIRDIYYPHVGKENQAGRSPCQFGVWTNGQFSWMGPEWDKRVGYRDNTLVTEVVARNDSLGIELRCSDCVDYEEPVFIREITVKELHGQSREVRLFFHHDLNFYENSIRDSVCYDPKTRAIVHFKGKRYCLVNVSTATRFGVDQYAVGEKGAGEREGTWRDAEDGILSGNPAADGSVDSTVGINLQLEAHGEQTCYTWMAFGTDYNEVKSYNTFVWEITPREIVRRTHNYWLLWATKEELRLDALPEDVRSLFTRSLLVLRTQTDRDGGITAGNDSDARTHNDGSYSYVWPRVGAIAALGLDEAGYPEMTRDFFTFCSTALSEDGYLLPRYFTDGALGSMRQPWVRNGKSVIPIQEDGIALVVYALWKHFERYRDIEFVESLYHTFILEAAEFMADYVDRDTNLPHPCFDVWEERYGVHTATVAAVIAALWAAARFARAFGDGELAQKYNDTADRMKDAMCRHLYNEAEHRFARSGSKRNHGYDLDMTFDVTLAALFTAGVLDRDDERVVSTIDQTWCALWVNTDTGGVARYHGDSFHRRRDDTASEKLPGNPWAFATLMMANWQIRRARNLDELYKAMPLIEWACSSALPSGILAEQVHPETCEPLSVSPSTLAHGEFVHVVMAYLQKLEQMQPERTFRRGPHEEMRVYDMPRLSRAEAKARVREVPQTV